MTKCIYCGFCQEACPVDAIVESESLPPIWHHHPQERRSGGSHRKPDAASRAHLGGTQQWDSRIYTSTLQMGFVPIMGYIERRTAIHCGCTDVSRNAQYGTRTDLQPKTPSTRPKPVKSYCTTRKSCSATVIAPRQRSPPTCRPTTYV
jgi:ferredoxin